MAKTGQYRDDRIFCYCDAYDFPHRYHSTRCEPGHTSTDYYEEKGEKPKGAIPGPKVTPSLGRKPRRDEINAWICPGCKAINPMDNVKCWRCKK